MSQQLEHPVSQALKPLEQETFDAMFELFSQIGIFWQNIADSKPYKSRLYAFMQNRIRLRPSYDDYYKIAHKTLTVLIAELGEEKAYQFLFTNTEINKSQSEIYDLPYKEKCLALTRQKVSNEFVAYQLALGGFKAFGAKNYLGYIGGAYIPDEPVPYRTAEEKK